MVTVVIADTHVIVREGIRALLNRIPDLRVVGEAETGPAAVDLVRRFHPNVLLLALSIRIIRGLEVAKAIAALSSPTHIVALSMYWEEEYALEAFDSGVCGYVLKGSGVAVLVDAIRRVAAGSRFLDPAISPLGVDEFLEKARRGNLGSWHSLTARERQVLALVAEGKTNHEIANLLSIGTRTVETHRARLMKKLGLKNQAELVRYAVRYGIVE